MGRCRAPEGPPASQSFPLFYIYRRIGYPVPLIPLDELPSWFPVDWGGWTDPWWLKDILPAESPNQHAFDSSLIPKLDRKDIFLRLLDPETKDEILRKIYRYVPKMSGSQLEKFPFNNEFLRRMMASRCGEFKPESRFYDPESPVQRFYLGHGIYPYLWGLFGEVIVFPDEEPLPPNAKTPNPSQNKRKKRNRAIKRWLTGVDSAWGHIELDDDVDILRETVDDDGPDLPPAISLGEDPPGCGVGLLLETVKDNGPNLPPGVSMGEVPLRKTNSASEYLTTGPMGGRPEGISEGVSLGAGVEFLLRIMRKGGGGS